MRLTSWSGFFDLIFVYVYAAFAKDDLYYAFMKLAEINACDELGYTLAIILRQSFTYSAPS
jgi:hypothetical protein